MSKTIIVRSDYIQFYWDGVNQIINKLKANNIYHLVTEIQFTPIQWVHQKQRLYAFVTY